MAAARCRLDEIGGCGHLAPRMCATAILAVLIASDATPEEDSKKKEKGIDAIIVPIPNIDPDLGFGLGLAGGMFLYAPGYRPYRLGLAAQASFTTRGVQTGFIR